MAKNKNSFLLYIDLIFTVEKMSDELAGKLFKHILRYVNDKNPEPENESIDLVFEQIKQSLKRDLKKYEKTCERNRENGKKGGRPKKDDNPKNPAKPNGLLKNPTEPKKADSDIDSDSDIEINNIYNLYPSKCVVKKTSNGKSSKNKDKIRVLLKTITPDKLKHIIKTYITECEKDKTYMKHFGTFLNNLPDYGESEKKERVKLYELKYGDRLVYKPQEWIDKELARGTFIESLEYNENKYKWSDEV